MNLLQFAKFSGMGQVRRQLKILNAAALRTGLIDSAISSDTVGKHPTLFDGHTAWLLAVDIFTCFGGQV